MTTTGNRRPWLLYGSLMVAVVLFFALSLMLGRGGSWLPGASDVSAEVRDVILYEVRLRHIFWCAAVGRSAFAKISSVSKDGSVIRGNSKRYSICYA